VLKLYKGKTANVKTVRKLETRLGIALSDPFRKFVFSNDGAIPEANKFIGNEELGCGVDAFISVEEIWHEKSLLNNLNQLAYPIAWAAGGNYIVIDPNSKNEVFFWDHEVENSLTYLAENFDEFLKNLVAFDLKILEDSPRKVISGWVDPDFLKSLKVH